MMGDNVDARPKFLNMFQKDKKGIVVPTKKDDFFYKMDHKRRGRAVIFNHEKFDPSLKLDVRTGTEVDSLNLDITLNNLGFKTKKYLDNTVKEIDSVLVHLSKKDFSDCDCLCVAVLSHGTHGVIYAKNDAYTIDMLLKHFTPDKCPTLAGKPKIFIIQACQGNKYDGGIDVRTRTVEIDSDANSSMYRIPLHADFLVGYSTVPGFYSWRNTTEGSWYIQAFCEELNKYCNEFDLLSILTMVNRRVAVDFESVNSSYSMNHQKQIPCFTSMLTRMVILAPKNLKNENTFL